MKKKVGPICPDCADTRHTIWQALNKDTVINSGDFVQCAVGYEDGSCVEHLWFQVLGTDGNMILGAVANDPIHLPLTYGEHLDFERSEIENHIVPEREINPHPPRRERTQR